MKRTALRLICLLLCAVMVMGMIPAAAAAAQMEASPAKAEGFIFRQTNGITYYEPATFDLAVRAESETGSLAFPAANSTAKTKISTPTELTWNKEVIWEYNDATETWSHSTGTRYGSVYFKVGSNYVENGMTLVKIRLYRNNEQVAEVWTGFDPNTIGMSKYLSVPVYMDHDFESGEYYFTVELNCDGGFSDQYDGSEIATSPVWNYTKPGSSYGPPTNARWLDGLQAAWEPEDDYMTHQIEVNYAPDKNTEPFMILRAWGDMRYCNDAASVAMSVLDSGYFSFKVRTLSQNISKKCHSDWAFSETKYFDGAIQLGAPSDITWSVTLPGSIYWIINKPVEMPESYYEIDLYKDSKKVHTDSAWGYSGDIDDYNARYFETSFYDEYDFTTGDYHVTVKAVATKDGFTDSETVKSPVWSYTHPGTRFSRPTNLKWNFPEVSWDSNYSNASYHVKVYYSATKDGTPEEIYFSDIVEETSLDLSRYIEYGGKGYYSFKVRTYSYDITTKYHSAWTDLCGPYYYTDKATALKITSQPQNVTVASGETAKVSFEAEGDGLTYTWYYKNSGDSSFSKTAAFTSNTYSVTMSEARDGRQIYCVVTDQYGNTAQTDTVTLSMVKNEVKIITQPESVVVPAGETASVTVAAEGDGLTYTWYYKNTGDSSFSKTTSFTSNIYSVSMSEARDGRQIYCVVTDQYGNTAQTDTVTLSMVKNEVKIITQPKSVVVPDGETAAVTVVAEGDGLTYEWYYKNSSGRYVITKTFTGDTYSITMNEERNGRCVYCIVRDAYGNSVQTKTVSLKMQTPLEIITQPKSVKVASGKQAKVTVVAQGDGLTYKWYYKNPGSTSYSYTSSFTSNSYYITMNEDRDGRLVFCRVYDKYGNMVQTNTVSLRME